MIQRILTGLMLLFASAASATEPSTTAMELEIEIPRLTVAEYHRPYVAVWISDERQQRVADVTVWYDIAMANEEGTKWLPDIRQWWRRSGRSLELPVDGVSAATRAPGVHHLHISHDILSDLDAGNYILHIEAAREVGGREHLRLPFEWPVSDTASKLLGDIQGEHELGRIRLHLNQ